MCTGPPCGAHWRPIMCHQRSQMDPQQRSTITRSKSSRSKNLNTLRSLPILLYGSETWTLLKSEMNKLGVFQTKCLRQLLGISLLDHHRKETIRIWWDYQLAVEDQIWTRRLRWFGHICRINTNRRPYKIMSRERPHHWRVQHAAPKKTWIKQIEEDLQSQGLTVDEAKCNAADR